MTNPVPRRTCAYLLIGAITLTFPALVSPAAAQGPPGGSYRQSCKDISITGATLRATCQTESGDWHATSFPNPADCPGDMANQNGALRCIIESHPDGFDLVTFVVASRTADSERREWRIDRPEVRRPEGRFYPIQFRAGDTVTIKAGGCVQTGGMGRTWKHYVYPRGDGSEAMYSGEISIPYVIGGRQRLSGVVSTDSKARTFPVSSCMNPEVRPVLWLGYEDDQWDDNGYYDHDDGNDDQCKGIGPAWVKVWAVSHGRAETKGSQPGAKWSPHSKPFDLVHDQECGWDGNGYALNPLWAHQINNPGERGRPDFSNICGSAISSGTEINFDRLRAVCTSQGVSTDLRDDAVDNLPIPVVTPLGPLVGNLDMTPLCKTGILNGHLNWSVGTFSGKITWDEWSGDAIPIADDDDFNIELSRADYAALTAAREPLLLEFKADESIDNFRSPWWVRLRNAAETGSKEQRNEAAGRILHNDKNDRGGKPGLLAVATGEIGLDGVHGGHTELHPVYSMAVLIGEKPAQGGVDETWAFFVRNTGGEGNCSHLEHDWVTKDWKYWIQIPWPLGASNVSLVGADAFANHTGIVGPELRYKAPYTYIGFRLLDPSALPAADGEITLRYTFFPGISHLTRIPTNAAPQPLTPHVGDVDSWAAIAKRISDPKDRERFGQALQAVPPIKALPRPHDIRLAIDSKIEVGEPPARTAHEGLRHRTRTRVDVAKQKARAEQISSIRAALQQNQTVAEPAELPPAKK